MGKVKRCNKYKDELIDLKFSAFCRHENEKASMLMSDDMTLFVTGDMPFNAVTIDCLCGSIRSLYDYANEKGFLDRISRREFCSRLIKWDVDASDVRKNLSIIIMKFIDKDEWNVVCTDVDPSRRYNFGYLTTGSLDDIFDIISRRLNNRDLLYNKPKMYDAISPVTKFVSEMEHLNGFDFFQQMTGNDMEAMYESFMKNDKIMPSSKKKDAEDFIMFVIRRLYIIWFKNGESKGDEAVFSFDSHTGEFVFKVAVRNGCSSFVLDFTGGKLGEGVSKKYDLSSWRELEIMINNLTGIDGSELIG